MENKKRQAPKGDKVVRPHPAAHPTAGAHRGCRQYRRTGHSTAVDQLSPCCPADLLHLGGPQGHLWSLSPHPQSCSIVEPNLSIIYNLFKSYFGFLRPFSHLSEGPTTWIQNLAVRTFISSFSISCLWLCAKPALELATAKCGGIW